MTRMWKMQDTRVHVQTKPTQLRWQPKLTSLRRSCDKQQHGIVRNDEKRQVRDGHVVCRIDSTISGTSLYVRVATVQMQLLGVTVGSFLIRGRPRRHKQDPNRVASLLKKRLSSSPAIKTLQVFPKMICLFTSYSWIYKVFKATVQNMSVTFMLMYPLASKVQVCMEVPVHVPRACQTYSMDLLRYTRLTLEDWGN